MEYDNTIFHLDFGNYKVDNMINEIGHLNIFNVIFRNNLLDENEACFKIMIVLEKNKSRLVFSIGFKDNKRSEKEKLKIMKNYENKTKKMIKDSFKIEAFLISTIMSDSNCFINLIYSFNKKELVLNFTASMELSYVFVERRQVSEISINKIIFVLNTLNNLNINHLEKLKIITRLDKNKFLKETENQDLEDFLMMNYKV